VFIDSHCHLDHPDFDADRAAVVSRARAAGVTHLITVGTDLDSSARAKALARAHPEVFATVGVHPHDAGAAPADYLARLPALADDTRVVAIGEIGLDFHYDLSPRDVQRRLFVEQIGLARQLGLPVVVHLREAYDEGLGALQREGAGEVGGVIHCFSGTLAQAQRALELGFSVSIPGIVTYAHPGELREVVRALPLDSLLVETDAPYLAPVPRRGQRNEPAFLRHTVDRIAELTGNTVADVRRTTGRAAARRFGLPLDDEQACAQIAYQIRDNLYLNITNACTLTCVFCPKRRERFVVKGHPLKLTRPPSVEEIKRACGDLAPYAEVVFVGLGESTLRLAVLKEVAGWLRAQGKRVRVDTDGLATLVHKRPVAAELAAVVDSVSVSLNAADAETYARVCPSRFGAEAHAAVKAFIVEARAAGIEVTASVVGLPEFDQAYLERCRRLAEEELGARFRVRAYDNVG